MKRILNIISRAVRDYDFEPDMNATLEDVWQQAENCITENIGDPDRIEECETNRHYDHINWNDGKGFGYDADGEFISRQQDSNTYYRYDDGAYRLVEWFDVQSGDYILMDCVFDTDGQYVGLVAKWGGNT